MSIRNKIRARNIVRKYTNGEVTIIWQPNKCCSSGICVKMSPKVFCPTQKPWIQPLNSTTEDIITTVEKCPSGALTYYMNRDETK